MQRDSRISCLSSLIKFVAKMTSNLEWKNLPAANFEEWLIIEALPGLLAALQVHGRPTPHNGTLPLPQNL